MLGQSAAFSCPPAQFGIQMNRGARIYFDALNAQGGVNGNTIEPRTLDDCYEPARCKANTDKFIKDEAFALFGYVGTPTSLAALPLVIETGLPFFGPFTGAEALRDPFHKTVFHLRASYHDEAALIVKQLTSLGLKKSPCSTKTTPTARPALKACAARSRRKAWSRWGTAPSRATRWTSRPP